MKVVKVNFETRFWQPETNYSAESRAVENSCNLLIFGDHSLWQSPAAVILQGTSPYSADTYVQIFRETE